MPIMCHLPLVTAGIPVNTAAGLKQIFLLVPAVTSDLPAKAMLRNAHGHTGTYACSQCDIKVFSVPSGSGHCIAFIEQQDEVIRKSHTIRFSNAFFFYCFFRTNMKELAVSAANSILNRSLDNMLI